MTDLFKLFEHLNSTYTVFESFHHFNHLAEKSLRKQLSPRHWSASFSEFLSFLNAEIMI